MYEAKMENSASVGPSTPQELVSSIEDADQMLEFLDEVLEQAPLEREGCYQDGVLLKKAALRDWYNSLYIVCTTRGNEIRCTQV